MVPVVVFPPGMLLTSQVTAVLEVLVTLAENCCVVFPGTLTLDGVTLTTGGSARMVTVVEADTAESAAAIAVTVSALGLGTVAGAVKRPDAEIVPVDAEPPVTPLTCHTTAELLELVTVAVNCWVAATYTEGLVGETETVGGARSVTVAVALAEVLASAAAVMVTVVEVAAVALRSAEEGKVLGAV